MANENTSSSKNEKAYEAATHDTERAPHHEPDPPKVTREETGRKSNESWKEEKNFDEESKLGDVDRDSPM
jgi:hypothetical protein